MKRTEFRSVKSTHVVARTRRARIVRLDPSRLTIKKRSYSTTRKVSPRRVLWQYYGVGPDSSPVIVFFVRRSLRSRVVARSLEICERE